MKRFLEFVERILGGSLTFLAGMGLFNILCYVLEIMREEPLPDGSVGIVFMVSMLLVYFLAQSFVEVRCKRLEILAEELENQTEESEELYEHLRVK